MVPKTYFMEINKCIAISTVKCGEVYTKLLFSSCDDCYFCSILEYARKMLSCVSFVSMCMCVCGEGSCAYIPIRVVFRVTLAMHGSILSLKNENEVRNKRKTKDI